MVHFIYETMKTQIYNLSLHDALPISDKRRHDRHGAASARGGAAPAPSHRAVARQRHSGCCGQLALRPENLRQCRPLRSEEHTSELQSHSDLVCRLLLEKKNNARI